MTRCFSSLLFRFMQSSFDEQRCQPVVAINNENRKKSLICWKTIDPMFAFLWIESWKSLLPFHWIIAEVNVEVSVHRSFIHDGWKVRYLQEVAAISWKTVDTNSVRLDSEASLAFHRFTLELSTSRYLDLGVCPLLHGKFNFEWHSAASSAFQLYPPPSFASPSSRAFLRIV